MPHRDEHMIIFEHRNFRGQHRHIFGREENLNATADGTLNDKVSSFVVISGNWKMYRHADFNEPYPREFPPGEYDWVENFDVDNDQVSSLKTV